MLWIRQGMPETDEIVLCTVTKVYFNSVFVNIDEYNKSGMIHISEISPGRIRNINDYVTVGKKVVCKILRIDLQKGHIDLSLRRVNEAQRRGKVEDIKQEQKAEKIIEIIGKELKTDNKKLYHDIHAKLDPKDYIYPYFQKSVVGNFDLAKLDMPKEIVTKLIELIKQRFKPPRVLIGGDLLLKSFEPNGVDIIIKAIGAAVKKEKSVVIKYGGAGLYSVRVESSDYKTAEKILSNFTNIAIKSISGNTQASFNRKEIKI